VLFYTTVYVGDIYKSGLPDSADPESGEVDAEATRLGTRALFCSACISLFCNFALPFLVPRVVKRRTIGDLFQEEGGVLKRIARKFQISLPMLWALSHALFALCMFSTLCVLPRHKILPPKNSVFPLLASLRLLPVPQYSYLLPESRGPSPNGLHSHS
jgi:solute carrier family 45 protein 1/2/4